MHSLRRNTFKDFNRKIRTKIREKLKIWLDRFILLTQRMSNKTFQVRWMMNFKQTPHLKWLEVPSRRICYRFDIIAIIIQTANHLRVLCMKVVCLNSYLVRAGAKNNSNRNFIQWQMIQGNTHFFLFLCFIMKEKRTFFIFNDNYNVHQMNLLGWQWFCWFNQLGWLMEKLLEHLFCLLRCTMLELGFI